MNAVTECREQGSNLQDACASRDFKSVPAGGTDAEAGASESGDVRGIYKVVRPHSNKQRNKRLASGLRPLSRSERRMIVRGQARCVFPVIALQRYEITVRELEARLRQLRGAAKGDR